jgi:8-oxo-dGTP pyrophosphatase MutT (NUDIX family)
MLTLPCILQCPALCRTRQQRSLWKNHWTVLEPVIHQHQRNAIVMRSSSYLKDAKSMMPRFMTWIERCNNGLSCISQGSFTPFVIHGATVGYVDGTFVRQHLEPFSNVFRLVDGKLLLDESVESLGLEERSFAVEKVLRQLHQQGVITGWRDEVYPVLTSFDADPVLLMERAASVYFGIKAYGVHLNGYVERKDGGIDMWVARRSAAKPTWPGKLDHIVAGGQPHGLSPMENVIKECEEEAGIGFDLASKAKPVGAVSYCSQYSYGLKRDVLFCFDLKLPDDFQPVANDGEVEEFYRLPIEDVLDIVARSEGDTYKDNCNLVVLDFMIRHGIISPDTPGYLDLLKGLRPSAELS